MTVKELIAKLGEMPGDAEVVKDNHYGASFFKERVVYRPKSTNGLESGYIWDDLDIVLID